ncbi:hypothetical protein V500_06680 [Pseudogymnoascus sp. VKM F-4518 (FW-2643)]|nr:hypothetical protein V500_06680 [Pseudogymnoascus sp. VKM F-4518 (FW-2643)]
MPGIILVVGRPHASERILLLGAGNDTHASQIATGNDIAAVVGADLRAVVGPILVTGSVVLPQTLLLP